MEVKICSILTIHNLSCLTMQILLIDNLAALHFNKAVTLTSLRSLSNYVSVLQQHFFAAKLSCFLGHAVIPHHNYLG